MRDPNPILGPRATRPDGGEQRNDPGLEQVDGGKTMPGIIVVPHRLYKPSTTRDVTISGVTCEVPSDASYLELP